MFTETDVITFLGYLSAEVEELDDVEAPKLLALWDEFKKKHTVGWICVTERLPTEQEAKDGVLFGIQWPEGKIDMVSWETENGTYDILCQHFLIFQPDRSSGIGYWRPIAALGPPKS